MLNIDRKSLLGLDGNFLKKQRTLLPDQPLCIRRSLERNCGHAIRP